MLSALDERSCAWMCNRAGRMVSGAARSGPSKAFALVVALTWVGSVGGSTSSASVFSFDMGKRHESISVLDKCTVAFKDFGDDYQSVLLKPAVSPGSSSYVEFLIEDQAEAQATPQAPPPTPGPAPRRIMDPSSAAVQAVREPDPRALRVRVQVTGARATTAVLHGVRRVQGHARVQGGALGDGGRRCLDALHTGTPLTTKAPSSNRESQLNAKPQTLTLSPRPPHHQASPNPVPPRAPRLLVAAERRDEAHSFTVASPPAGMGHRTQGIVRLRS